MEMIWIDLQRLTDFFTPVLVVLCFLMRLDLLIEINNVLVKNRDKASAVLRIIREAVVLRFDNDVLKRSRFDDLRKHTVKLVALFDVAHQNHHTTTLFKR